jgi:hypothetical protein
MILALAAGMVTLSAAIDPLWAKKDCTPADRTCQSSRLAQVDSSAGQCPTFDKLASYKQARQTLLQGSWMPARTTDADECWREDTRCRDAAGSPSWPEMEACAGSGEGNCRYRWRKNGKLLVVYTIDDPPLIREAECQSAPNSN